MLANPSNLAPTQLVTPEMDGDGPRTRDRWKDAQATLAQLGKLWCSFCKKFVDNMSESACGTAAGRQVGLRGVLCCGIAAVLSCRAVVGLLPLISSARDPPTCSGQDVPLAMQRACSHGYHWVLGL